MMKKAGANQLQTECNTDEEFDKFLEKDGILVLDIYTDWCGSCIGMIGSLKKIKMEQQDDDELNLTICRSDDIEKLARFRNLSEPTWLVCTQKKILRMMKGTNGPKLIAMIYFEIEQMRKIKQGEIEDERLMYEFYELTPEEQEELAMKIAFDEEVLRIEQIEAIRLRHEYIRHVTDQIMEHVIDAGITIFFPHTLREVECQTVDMAEKLELTCKERKYVKIEPQMMEILNFEVENPMPNDLMSYLYHREVLIFLWKLGETDTRAPEEVLQIFHQAITDPIPMLNEKGEPTENVLPPLLEGKTVKVISKMEKSRRSSQSLSNDLQEQENEIVKKESDSHILMVPACWTPHNKRANAAYIYIFFRNHTDHFLPADPIPEPPHLCFVFDAYKKDYIFELLKLHPNDFLAYGFFTSGDIENCTLLARTCDRYEKLKPTSNDKLIIKVAKTSSGVFNDLKEMGPQYSSVNTVQGRSDCFRLFPDGFKNEDSDAEDDDSVRKKKHKKKKNEVIIPDVNQNVPIDRHILTQDSEDNTLEELSEDESNQNLGNNYEPPFAPAPTPDP